MERYFQEFMEMAEAIRSASHLRLLNFALFDPASEMDIARVEEALKSPLHPSIREFYAISNGLQLRWIHVRNPEFNPKLHQFEEGPFDYLRPLDAYAPEDGCVNILPIQISFVDQDWAGIVWSYADEGEIEFAGVTRDRLAFMRAVKSFDLFAKSTSMVFIAEEGIGNPQVLLARDHFADVSSSRITDFESYLHFLLHHSGLVSARQFYVQYGGHNEPPMKTPAEFWAQQPKPDLEGLYK